MDILVNDIEIVTANKEKTYKYICLMHKNFYKAELDECIALSKDALENNLVFLAWVSY